LISMEFREPNGALVAMPNPIYLEAD